MKHTIDLWGNEFPSDYRWDDDKNAKLLNIVFYGGTFGNFLKFFLDKFSKLSPDLPGDPFTDTGTSHLVKSVKFSGLIQRYHPSFINDNRGETQLPVCLILPTTRKHHLYLKTAQWFRAGDRKVVPDDLWRMALGEMPEFLREVAQQVIKLYDIKEMSHFSWIPKFIVRDFYKLEFLQDLKDTHNCQWFDTFKSHEFFGSQKVYHLDLETFFSWKTFVMNITELDRVFELSLDFDRSEEMEQLFDKGLGADRHRQECNRVEEILDGRFEGQLYGMDVSSEAYIYAEMERRHDFVQMPLTNRFFRDPEEMRQFVEFYPNHYKAMNPNLPKFNGIDNPFYLHSKK
jgi:hypothetical protein